MLAFTHFHLVPGFFPPVLHVTNSAAGMRRGRVLEPARLRVVGESRSRVSVVLGFWEGRKEGGCGFVRRCRDSDLEGDFALEAEILEFMKGSDKPRAFPSKRDLVEAGRLDLVDAIVREGGWLSLGWDLGDEETAQDSGGFRNWDEGYESSDSDMVSDSSSSSVVASSSGTSLEAATTEVDTGIEGILNRLEKQRNLTLGFVLRDKEDSTGLANNDNKHDRCPETSTDATVGATSRSIRPASSNPTKAILSDLGGPLNHSRSLLDADVQRNYPKPEMWRTWSSQRAGSSDLEFEAGEVSYDEMGGSKGVLQNEILQTKEGANEPNGRNDLDSEDEVINYKQVRIRMQHLESELSSVLHSLRSKTSNVAPKEMGDHESSSDDLWKVSDAWEFQENEIMHAQNKLRSTRAKLAVLEGKMAMAIIAVQKKVEEKQKRVNDARRALRLLRTALIVWTNPASEVLLAGSYDGWATQRKMERSSTGIFSVSLKLYPGRYEIKFIVDGEWRIDPLRPIVRNDGFENNILIIT
ncbi:protein PTST homolog 2, chloroplastic isoform X1 [Rosa rugosa]|uniref:protein PTST homolog 2, chloroplastic isoform X1 n=1 Tax=Rosa rugosa TaxID=74645 RepID=UPI002B409E36|nr:protein PTST homolog 2, chloroplastic isoform X1 [Rosa rugosa]